MGHYKGTLHQINRIRLTTKVSQSDSNCRKTFFNLDIVDVEPPEFLVMVRERDSLVPGDDVVVYRQNGLGIDSHPRNLELETRDDDDKMRLETK